MGILVAMKVAYLLYSGFTALDIVGPHDVLDNVPGTESVFVAETAGPVRNDSDTLSLVADHSLDQVTAPDILVIPGGFGTKALLGDESLLDWIRMVHLTSNWTTSVCTGSMLLAAAGLLNGVPATTHWLYREQLRELGADVRTDRVVEHGKVMTAAGVSAGIDMALRLIQVMNGEKMAKESQLAIEYDPAPPFDSGSPEKAGQPTIDAVTTAFAKFNQP